MGTSTHRKKVVVIHGPNLNLLGVREPAIYGIKGLDEINRDLITEGNRLGLELECMQTNSEAEIIDRIHGIFNDTPAGLIINPAAYTHTSVAIRDALACIDILKVEVHLSNIYKRESFRRRSLISEVVTGSISGFGHLGYIMALWFISERVNNS